METTPPPRTKAPSAPVPTLLCLALAATTLPVPAAFSQEPASAKPAPAAASPAGDLPSDEAILKRLPELSTDYLRNLLGVYARLNNGAMTKALTGELNRRNPGAVPEKSAEEIVNRAMEEDTDPPSPHEALENEIDRLTTAQKHAEAIALMERHRKERFAGQTFPFDIELGDAYGTTGNFAAAREAYTRALNAKGASKEATTLARAGLREIDRLEGLQVAYNLITRKQPAEALKKAEELRRQFPEDVDVQLLYAQALVPNYHFLEALPMLEAIKTKHYVGKPYPAQDALAECLQATGRLDDAERAYEELARDATVTERVRSDAALAAREVARMRSATVQADAEVLSEEEGDAAFLRARAAAPLGDGWHAGVDAWYYDVSLSSERSLRQSSGDFLGAVAFVRKYLDDNLTYLETRAGWGSQESAAFGATVGRERTHPGVLGYDLSVDFNQPAMDSLQLIALHGIEDRVATNVAAPLPGRFEVTAGAWARRVDADGADLGDGWGAYFEVGRPVWENARETSQITVAYRADYERFDASPIGAGEAARLGYAGDPADGRLLGAELIEPRYHPHGLQATYESRLSDSLYYFLGTGLYFDFSDEEWDYNFTGGFEYAISDTLDLILEGGYYSDGTGASNDDSAVMVGTIGVRRFY